MGGYVIHVSRFHFLTLSLIITVTSPFVPMPFLSLRLGSHALLRPFPPDCPLSGWSPETANTRSSTTSSSQSASSRAMRTKTARDGSRIFLTIYVDDMLLFGRHAEELAELVRELRLKIAMKDLGPARHILGMKITRNRN